MSISNHLLAGSLIGLMVGNPVLAIVLAYASHFAMDAIPHYGYPESDNFKDAVKEMMEHKLAYVYALLTAITFVVVVLCLLIGRNYFPLVVGLVALSPDVIMTGYYALVERKNRVAKGIVAKINLTFHGKVQFERPWGILVEVAVFVLLSYQLAAKL